jgi:hypothetical protein
MAQQRVQLNRWVLPETLEFLNNLAIVRGYKQGPMMDRVIEEYQDPPVYYLMDKLVEKLPKENYFTEAERFQLEQLKEIIDRELQRP